MKKIFLHGELGESFKKIWFLHVESPADAIAALIANDPSIHNFLSKKEQEGIAYSMGYYNGEPIKQESEYYCKSKKDLHIFPVPAGGMAMAGNLLMTGATQYASSFLSAKIERWKQKKLNKLNQADDGKPIIIQTKSYLAAGKDNRYQQGSVVPLGYGRMKLGSNVISSCNLSYEYDSATNTLKSFGGGAIAGLTPPYIEGVYPEAVLAEETEAGQGYIIVENEGLDGFIVGDDIQIGGDIRYISQISNNRIELDSGLGAVSYSAGTIVRNIENPVRRSKDFDGAGPLGYSDGSKDHRKDARSLRLGGMDSLYGDIESVTSQRKNTVTARYGDDWGGYLYYKYNWGKGIDKDKINMGEMGNWKPESKVKRVDDRFFKQYVLGNDSVESSYVGLQSMPRQENSEESLDPKTKRFYPIIHEEGGGRPQQVGSRWKDERRKESGVGWYKLESVSIYKSIDLVCEGPIEGFCDKNGTTLPTPTLGSTNDDFLQGVFLDDTPVKEKTSYVTNGSADVYYNVNEFDIDVASSNSFDAGGGVLGAQDQRLLKEHYLFTAHTKEVNQRLYGPRKANPADIVQGYEKIQFKNSSQSFQNGDVVEWEGIELIDSDNDESIDARLNVEKVGKVEALITHEVNFKESHGYNLSGDYRAIEPYGFRTLKGGYSDPKYSEEYYPGDDSYDGLIMVYNGGRWFTPHIGWDNTRSNNETINDYRYFSGEYVDPSIGRYYKPGDKVRTLADNGEGIIYSRMGKYANKFLGIYSDAEIDRFNGEIGSVAMSPTKNKVEGQATTSNSLYLITGSISSEDLSRDQYGNKLNAFALQLFVLNEEEDGAMSSDPWFVCNYARDAILKTTDTNVLAGLRANNSLKFVGDIFEGEKDDVTPKGSPHLWDEVKLESPDYAWVRTSPDMPVSSQFKGLSPSEYIATMFGESVESKEIEESEGDRDLSTWQVIVRNQPEAKKEILGPLEGSKSADYFKIARHNRVSLINYGPLFAIKGIKGFGEIPRVNFSRFYDLNKTGSFPFSSPDKAKLYEVDAVIMSEMPQSQDVIYVRISDPNSEMDEDRTEPSDANKGFYATMTLRPQDAFTDSDKWETEDREIERYSIKNLTFTDDKGNTRSEIVKEIKLKDSLSFVPGDGYKFKIIYKYKSSSSAKQEEVAEGFDVLEITDTKFAASVTNKNKTTLYFKLQKAARDPRHNFIALWVDAVDLTSVYNFTKIVAQSEDHAGDYYFYENIASRIFTELGSSNLRLTVQKEEEFFVNHSVINPLVDRVYVGLQINELYYIYAGDEVEITYKIGKMMALIFSIMIAINVASIVGSFGIGFGLSIVAVSNFGWLLFLAVVGLIVGWIVYIGLRSAKFKIGTRIDNSGELWPNRAKFRIKYGNVGEHLWSTDVYLYGVATDSYRKDVKIFLPPNPNNKDRIIKVFKLNRERNPVIEGEQAARYKNDFSVYAFTEIVPTKLNYPNSVVVGTRINARDMGGRLPTRNYHLKLKRVPVPSNYDPEIRKYDGPWDGLFKGQASLYSPVPEESKVWTDNPAWCLYDLISDKAYGAGKFGINLDHIDRWTLYSIAKYCDGFVPTGYSPKYPKKRFEVSEAGDGSVVMVKGSGSQFLDRNDFLKQFGQVGATLAVFYEDGTHDLLKIRDYETNYTKHKGKPYYAVHFEDNFTVTQDGDCCLEIDYPVIEPRHTINAVLMEEQNAYTLINEFAEIFRAYSYWADGKIKFFQDGKKDPLMFFNNTNVFEEGFSYSNMPKTNRVNVSKVRYLDKYESYKPKLEMSQDREAINNNNIIEESNEGFGITSKSQAKRLTEFSLKSANLETEMVSFSTSLIGSYLRPGDVFQVLDSNRTIGRYAGKIVNTKIDQNSRFLYLYLDYPVDCDINPHDRSTWKDVTIYNLGEFETIEALNLDHGLGISDERIDNLRKSQLGKIKAVDISQGKEKITIVDNTYEYIPGEFTFKEAIEDSINKGGEIASIGTELDQYLAYLSLPKSPGNNAWIGGYINSNEDFVWHAPKRQDPTIDWFDWKEGYPKEAEGDLSGIGLSDEPSYENYGNHISLYASETNTYHAKWILNHESTRQGYILERKSSNTESSIFKFKGLKNKSFMIEDEVNMASAKTFSVVSIEEQSNGVFKITGKEYNRDKFENIENNLSIKNPYVPVIWTDRIIKNHEVNASVEVETIEEEGKPNVYYLVSNWQALDQPSGFFRVTYFNGNEAMASFELKRAPTIDEKYSHRIFLPEYSGKELFRVEVFLTN